MKKNTIVIVGVVVLVLISLAIYVFILQPKNTQLVGTDIPPVRVSSKSSETSSVLKNESTGTSNSSGKYIEYSKSSLTDSKNVIFFAANWCPTCRGLDKAINSSLSTIPSNLTILKADYDTETVLKQKYGVTYQHTLVQVDIDGNLIKKWSGSTDISEIIKEIR